MLHVDCFGEALNKTRDGLDCKNYYACNPAFDKGCGKMENC